MSNNMPHKILFVSAFSRIPARTRFLHAEMMLLIISGPMKSKYPFDSPLKFSTTKQKVIRLFRLNDF